jgi:hypothetical protein
MYRQSGTISLARAVRWRWLKRSMKPAIAAPPYATYVARTIFMHTLAFNDQLKGLSPEHLRYSIIGPQTDISFIEAARQKFMAQSAYLDDRPGSPLRFLAEANLTQIIRRQQDNVDQGDLRAELNDRIKSIFGGPTFEAVPFPSGPWEVPDEVGNGRPLLAIVSYDGCSVSGAVETVPDLIAKLYERKARRALACGLYATISFSCWQKMRGLRK